MENLLKKASQTALINSDMHASEIPTIDLYMDQIITFIEEKYDAKRRKPDEKLLTKTMINNYSKEGLIKPVKGKKYTKEQIMQMLLVYEMKNTLSIGEIKQAMQNAYSSDSFDLISAWETSLIQKQLQREKLPEILNELCLSETTQKCEKTNALATLLAVVALSSTCQRIAQNMIEELIEE